LRDCRGEAELAPLLEHLPASVAQIGWDATPQARALKVTAVGDLLAVVRGDSEEHQQG
jgi:hypothetical protein